MKNIFLFIFFICIVIPKLVFSQELPPINNYSPNNYNGGRQNWSITQSENKNIYIGNNADYLSLMEQDGHYINLQMNLLLDQ